jgi:hypothetical protein
MHACTYECMYVVFTCVTYVFLCSCTYFKVRSFISSVAVCMYAYMYVRIHTYIHAYIHIYIYMCMYACTFDMYVFDCCAYILRSKLDDIGCALYVCINVCICLFMYVCMHASMQAYMRRSNSEAYLCCAHARS